MKNDSLAFRFFSAVWMIVLLGLIVLGESGCASPKKKTAIGAGAGAVTGATVGGAIGGGKGAAIGAMIGGVTGGSIGNYLDKQAQELEKVADTQRTEEGILVKLKNDLLFETGSSVLKPEAETEVVQLGKILAQYPEDRIKVEGHTDSIGRIQDNEELSKKRANSVKNVLSSQGVKDNQIFVVGYGESKPIASNKTVEGRATNRRVELHIDVPEKS